MRLRVTVSETQLPNAEGTIQAIVDNSWRPYGLTFDWATEPDANMALDHVDAWIAAVNGMTTSPDGEMGQVLFNHGIPRRLIRISIDNVIAWVLRQQSTLFQTATTFHFPTLGDTSAASSRALGHIAAHELGHFVLGRNSHARSGLMDALWDWNGVQARRLLNLESLPLDAGNASTLKSRLAEAASCP